LDLVRTVGGLAVSTQTPESLGHRASAAADLQTTAQQSCVHHPDRAMHQHGCIARAATVRAKIVALQSDTIPADLTKTEQVRSDLSLIGLEMRLRTCLETKYLRTQYSMLGFAPL
jgi:hypothetical protein